VSSDRRTDPAGNRRVEEGLLDCAGFERYDWEQTPLGPREGWPRQLHFLSNFLLCSEQPMFLLWGSERLFIYNGAYQALWGDRSTESLGWPVERVAGENWGQLQPLVRRVFEGSSFVERNFALPDPIDGRIRYFDLSYTPVHDYEDPQGPVLAALGITTDVTEQFLLAERMRQEREILSLTVENVTEGVALIERDFSLVLWNEPFRLHFGYEPGQIRHGMNAAELMQHSARQGDLGPGDPGATVAALVQSIRETESGSLEVQRRNGTVLNLLRRALSGGRHLLVSQDITDERRIARLKDELVSTVSHELRTPLSAISGALGIVAAGAAGELSEKAERLIAIAQRNSERLIALVNDLLDADKLQSGTVEFQWERIDMTQLVRAAVEQNQTYGEGTGVTIGAELPDAPVVVRGDRNRLLQVLANLMSNAVKFSPAGGQVTVAVAVDGPTARISVIDRGMGVPEQFRGRLFDRFSQHDGSASRVQQGTGLGLAISRSIVEQLGGSIRFEPTIPQGATFHVDLPLATD
jgi:signal transduction histidine kinase